MRINSKLVNWRETARKKAITEVTKKDDDILSRTDSVTDDEETDKYAEEKDGNDSCSSERG